MCVRVVKFEARGSGSVEAPPAILVKAAPQETCDRWRVVTGSRDQSGSFVTTAAIVSVTSSPSSLDCARDDPEPVEGPNARCPVSIS